MESRIADILDRMDKENIKLKELRKKYVDCQKMRSNEVSISTDGWVYTDLYSDKRETIKIKLDMDIATKVLDLLEQHYTKLGNQCNSKLKAMVEEMKQEQ